MELNNEDLMVVSFPDTEVTSMEVDLATSSVLIKCLDGYLNRSSGRKCIEDVVIKISNFESITAKEFIEKINEVRPNDQEYFLKDICEFSFDGRNTVLKGFSKQRGYWSEYHITGGHLVISYAKEISPLT